MKRPPRFKSADFEELTDELKNPFRGWYSIYNFRVGLEPELDPRTLKDGESCALVILDIGAYRARDLDGKALGGISRILGFFDENKKDIILRIAYDTDGRGAEHEPSALSRVISHISQLRETLKPYLKRIVFYEGMLVGSWGEMHGSRFLSKSNMREIDAALSECLVGVFRAVRTPSQWRTLNRNLPAEGTVSALFNDAVFGSESDLGTFAKRGFGSSDWEEKWETERELEFEKKLGEFVPQCGEAVFGEELPCTPEYAAKRLRAMNMSCLNGGYDEKILVRWRNSEWKKRGPWRGMNGFDYIGRHLGYRFCIRSAEMRIKKGELKLSATVENIGFAGFYQDAVMSAVVEEGGARAEYPSAAKVRGWKAGQTKTFEWSLPEFEGRAYLSLRRAWDGAPILFANRSDASGSAILGEVYVK